MSKFHLFAGRDTMRAGGMGDYVGTFDTIQDVRKYWTDEHISHSWNWCDVAKEDSDSGELKVYAFLEDVPSTIDDSF